MITVCNGGMNVEVWKSSSSWSIISRTLTGCFGEKPEENLYTAFETAATQEKSLVDEAKN